MTTPEIKRRVEAWSIWNTGRPDIDARRRASFLIGHRNLRDLENGGIKVVWADGRGQHDEASDLEIIRTQELTRCMAVIGRLAEIDLDRSPELRELAIKFLELSAEITNLVSIHFEFGSTSGTRWTRCTFKPTERLIGLTAAFASELNREVA